LSLPERLSLLRAMAVAPNSSYLYAAASGKVKPTPSKTLPVWTPGSQLDERYT
jgi:hypothetical protein